MEATHVRSVAHFEGVPQVFHAARAVASELAGGVAGAQEAIGNRKAPREAMSRARTAAWLNSRCRRRATKSGTGPGHRRGARDAVIIEGLGGPGGERVAQLELAPVFETVDEISDDAVLR